MTLRQMDDTFTYNMPEEEEEGRMVEKVNIKQHFCQQWSASTMRKYHTYFEVSENMAALSSTYEQGNSILHGHEEDKLDYILNVMQY